MIPDDHASDHVALALKLWSNERKRHRDGVIADEGWHY